MPRSTPSLPALLAGLALGALLTGCVTPPLNERPSADEQLDQLLETQDAPAPELARDLRSLSLQQPEHVARGTPERPETRLQSVGRQ